MVWPVFGTINKPEVLIVLLRNKPTSDVLGLQQLKLNYTMNGLQKYTGFHWHLSFKPRQICYHLKGKNQTQQFFDTYFQEDGANDFYSYNKWGHSNYIFHSPLDNIQAQTFWQLPGKGNNFSAVLDAHR